MATDKMKVTSWSFSRYSLWRQCPLKFKLSALMKIAEPKNDAMQRGADIHTTAEQYLKGVITKLPAELKLFADEFKKLRLLYKKRAVGITVEDNWAFTNTWDRTEWNNWVKCWVRIKLDAAHVEANNIMIVTDWKSGKMRAELHEEYLEQLQLYALAALLLHPYIEYVKPRLVYLDQGMTYPMPDEEIVYDRTDIPKLKKLWEKRVKPMFADTSFVAKPNDKCHWCFYGQSGKAKGGPGLCKY
jgi:hypothetical protein